MSNIGDEVKKIYGHELEEKKKRNAPAISTDGKMLYIVISIIAAIIIFAAIFYWNKFVILQQTVFTKEGQMEKEYQRRNDLIPNLIEITRDYAQHERQLFKYVSDVRTGLESAENLMKEMRRIKKVEGKNILSKMMALAEQYPDLKATQSFQDLMDKLEEQENRLADTRDAYNKAAQVYNTVLATFPSSFFNFFFRFKQTPYFRAEERRVIAVSGIKKN